MLPAMPRLGDVLDAWLALVVDQDERQGVLVRSTEFINARALAGFGYRSGSSCFLNRDGIACDRIVAPDLCLWLRSSDMKRAISIDCPNRAQRVSPCASERSWTGRSSRTRTYQHDQNACENNSERI